VSTPKITPSGANQPVPASLMREWWQGYDISTNAPELWRGQRLVFMPESFFDLLVGLVLTQRIHRPNRRRDPTDEGYLQNQAENPGNRPTDCEESQPRQKQRYDQAHR
jgi:hypothetical protein